MVANAGDAMTHFQHCDSCVARESIIFHIGHCIGGTAIIYLAGEVNLGGISALTGTRQAHTLHSIAIIVGYIILEITYRQILSLGSDHSQGNDEKQK